MTLRTRVSVGLGALAIGLGGIAAVGATTATATQAATQTEINGIVAATNLWTTQTQGYSFNEYTVGNIAISSVNPSYARAQILPVAAYKNSIPQQWVVLTGAGSTWTVVDNGQNFCDNVSSVPQPVLNDLFPSGQQCGPQSNKVTLATQTNGGYRLVLQAQRGTGSANRFGTAYLQQWTTSGAKLTERRVGPVNGFGWSVITQKNNAYLTLNSVNQWALVQLYQSPGALYSVYPFKVTAFGLTPTNYR